MKRSFLTLSNKVVLEDPSVQLIKASALTGRNEILAELISDVRQIATIGVNFQPLPGTNFQVFIYSDTWL